MNFHRPQRQYAIDALLLVGAGLAGAGIGEIVSGTSKSPSAPEQAALPDKNKADKAGATTIGNQRQLLLAAGGQTDYTEGLGFLAGSDVAKQSLVGG